MATIWKHWYIIITPEDQTSLTSISNTEAAAWDPDKGGAETFRYVQLSATGLPPSTHTACSTRATDDMQKDILAVTTKHPGMVGKFKVYDVDKGWPWAKVLQTEGLQVIEVKT